MATKHLIFNLKVFFQSFLFSLRESKTLWEKTRHFFFFFETIILYSNAMDKESFDRKLFYKYFSNLLVFLTSAFFV